MSDKRTNYTAHVKLEVRAEDPRDADKRISEMLRRGYEKESGVSLIAEIVGIYEGAPGLLDKVHPPAEKAKERA